MAEDKVKAEVYCLSCKEEQPQTLVYVEKYLKEMRCDVCGSVFRTDRKTLLKVYADDLLDRVLLKPYRMKKELLGKHLSEILRELTPRIASKPARVAREITELFKPSLKPKQSGGEANGETAAEAHKTKR